MQDDDDDDVFEMGDFFMKCMLSVLSRTAGLLHEERERPKIHQVNLVQNRNFGFVNIHFFKKK